MKRRVPRTVTFARLGLFIIAWFTFQTAVGAQAPESIAGQAFRATVSSGSGPFASSGEFIFFPSGLDSSYAFIPDLDTNRFHFPRESGSAENTSMYWYAKTGADTASIQFINPVSGAVNSLEIAFTNSNAGTFRRAASSAPGSFQSGSFTMYSGNAPASIIGDILAATPASATASATAFFPSGYASFDFIPATAGSAYQIIEPTSGHSDGSGTYAYTPGRSTAVLPLRDSASLVDETIELSFSSSLSGAFYARKSDFPGYQTGFFVITAAPTEKPSLTITSAGPTARITNEVSAVTGTAKAGLPLTSVFWRLNSGAWKAAEPLDGWTVVESVSGGTFTTRRNTNPLTNWTASVEFASGTNVFSAYAQDAAGNVSATNSMSFEYGWDPAVALGR